VSLFGDALTGYLEQRNLSGVIDDAPPDDPAAWLKRYFPNYFVYDFSPEQEEFWDHVWNIGRGVRPRPYVIIWPRGWAKSTSLEAAVAVLGARHKRRYILYVSGTQDQADDHVQNIGDMLGTPEFARSYPGSSERDVDKFGTYKGWRRNRLRTAGGWTVDAIGLDTAARGKKLDEDRPDLIIFDDLDDTEDTERVTEKKMRAITRKLLPAGAEDLAVLAGQNLVHPDSIFTRMSDGRAKFLADRIVSGPIPAIEDLVYDENEYARTGNLVIEAGRPTWIGMNMERCKSIIRDEGGESFMIERQHAIDLLFGPIYRKEFWQYPDRKYHMDQPIPSPYDDLTVDEVIGRYLFWDTAYRDEDAASDTAVAGFELLSSWRVRLCYLWSGRVEFPALLQTVIDTAEDQNQDGGLSGVVIEDKASGISALQTLYLAAPAWLSDVIDSFQPGGRGKDERDRQAALYARAGGVLLPHPDPRIPELGHFFEEELTARRPAKRDRRDAFTMGVLYLERWLAEWHRSEMMRLHGMTIQ
jgi:hypothetical protein